MSAPPAPTPAPNRLAEAAALFRSRRYDACESIVASLVAADPSGAARHMLAECQLARGDLDAAAASYDLALKQAPGHAPLWTGLADLALWRGGLPGWQAAIDRGLAWPVLPPDSFHLLVRKACLLWMHRETGRCDAILDHLSQALTRHGAPLAQALAGYTMSTAIHLRGLRAAEARGHCGHYAGAAGLPPVFLLGDSHCIAPAGSVVPLEGRPHRVVPLYVLGCKAWHLGPAPHNPYKACAARLAAAVPPGSPVLASAGDIDCRLHSGFDNLRRRTGADVSDAIAQTVEAYLDTLAAMLPGRQLLLLSPPSRRTDLVPDAADRAALATIAAAFQAALAAACRRRALPLVDYHALTTRPDSSADPALFVDAHHLSADALRQALAALQ